MYIIKSNIWFLVQFEKTYTREFFKDFKLHSSIELVQFW
jgi:hypothetical protein